MDLPSYSDPVHSWCHVSLSFCRSGPEGWDDISTLVAYVNGKPAQIRRSPPVIFEPIYLGSFRSRGRDTLRFGGATNFKFQQEQNRLLCFIADCRYVEGDVTREMVEWIMRDNRISGNPQRRLMAELSLLKSLVPKCTSSGVSVKSLFDNLEVRGYFQRRRFEF